MIRPKKQLPYQRRKRSSSINQKIAMNNATLYNLPIGTVLLDHQVAGHTFEDGKDTVGMLKNEEDGSILKPAYKTICGPREIQFYEQIQHVTDTKLLMLKELVPEYRGTIKIKLGDRKIDFIKLADTTYGMSEPCILDIKIGKRTWDPLATAEKIATEEQKYQACKQNLGYCIPGFQVYSVKTGNIKRYGKDYGKKLNETSIKDALKIFLNADQGLCRPLLVQFLSGLWAIQKWARTQTKLKFYSSSILLAYDARCLRNSLESYKINSSNNVLNLVNNQTPSPIVPRRPNTADINHQKNVTPTTTTTTTTTTTSVSPFTWPSNVKINVEQQQQPPLVPAIEVYKKVQRSHSTQNNYEEDIKSMRENYKFMLDNLIVGYNNKEWATTKMIDFAHVFQSDDETLDTNYLFGIENLVNLFEEFLQECNN